MPLLQTTTAEGALKGMILARAPHELGEQEAAYLQDCIINQPGFVSRRGAIQGTTAITAANLDSQRPAAICTVTDPLGVQKIGVVYIKDTGAAFQFWMSVFTADGNFTFIQKHFLCSEFSSSVTYPVRTWMVQCAPGVDGSVIINIRSRYDRIINGSLVSPTAAGRTLRWFGSCPTTSTPSAAVTATLVATQNSTTVTGAAAEIAKVSFPGTVIFNVGVVASISSTTAVELVAPAPKTYGATALNYYVVEMLPAARARGRVSCTTGVLTGVVGYGTKLTESSDTATAVSNGGWNIYDPATLKLVAYHQSNPHPSDTVTGTPTAVLFSMSMKNYLMYPADAILPGGSAYHSRFNTVPNSVNPTPPRAAKGSWWTTYKGYNISFNAVVEPYPTNPGGDITTTGRMYVHGPRFPEIMDHSQADGDWGEVMATKPGDADGVAIQGGTNCVVLCKGQETFALHGDDPSNFVVDKIADDGALTYESVTSWKGNPIWMGKTGIWMYDGANEPENIVEKTLGARWTTLLSLFDGKNITSPDSDSYRLNQARCFVYQDYLFVNVTNTGFQHSIYTDGVQRTNQNAMYLCIYMPTRACSFLTNFNFQGFLTLGQKGYVLLPQLGSTTHHWFPLDNLFIQGLATVDTILTVNSYNSGSVSTSVGPWFHMESRKFDAGDGLWRKNWKQLAIEFNESNTKRMWLETVAGLNTTGVRALLPYVGTGLFKAARVKFRTRDQYMSFRLYEDISNRPASLVLGAWQWGYKFARRGSV